MSTARERVIQELAELRERLQRLQAFMCDSEGDVRLEFLKLPRSQQMLMRFQVYAMSLYEDILDERLREWQE